MRPGTTRITNLGRLPELRATTRSWSDLLGSDWRGSGASSDSESEDSVFTSDSDSGDADDKMPDLLPLGFPDSDDEHKDPSNSDSDDSSLAQSSSGQGEDGAEEWDWDWDNIQVDNNFEMPRSNNPLCWVWHSLEEMHAQWYEMPLLEVEVRVETELVIPAWMYHVINHYLVFVLVAPCCSSSRDPISNRLWAYSSTTH
ncbi:hypothetical protein B0H11DRAFT_2206610 [Mycena galericulata]|nr:hypothetical protein B0H11DRAFT_2206610 [Mycena galericulata]